MAKNTQINDNQSLNASSLKALREKLGKTQGQLAADLGYSGFVAINRKENGAAPITRQDELIVALRFAKVCKQLGIVITL
jgi:DNA-binding XRE family transcriptional regulator